MIRILPQNLVSFCLDISLYYFSRLICYYIFVKVVFSVSYRSLLLHVHIKRVGKSNGE